MGFGAYFSGAGFRDLGFRLLRFRGLGEFGCGGFEHGLWHLGVLGKSLDQKLNATPVADETLPNQQSPETMKTRGFETMYTPGPNN